MKKKIKKRKSAKRNFIVENYKKTWRFFKESKNYVLFSVFVFVLSSVIGFAFPIFFEEQIFNFIKELVARVEGLNVYELTAYIFSNNLRTSFLAIALGFILGIFPLMIGITNGYLLGFVVRKAVAQEGILVMWRLLPHGIFELPAVIISIGIGLKLGIEIWKKDSWKILKKNFKESLRFFIFVVFPLLLIAAIIEGILVFYLG